MLEADIRNAPQLAHETVDQYNARLRAHLVYAELHRRLWKDLTNEERLLRKIDKRMSEGKSLYDLAKQIGIPEHELYHMYFYPRFLPKAA